MIRTVLPGARSGHVKIPASKSQAHRILICAALSRGETDIVCDGISNDISATIGCMRALGAEIEKRETGLHVRPVTGTETGVCHMPCGESGSTLRFLLPVVGALGARAVFHMEGRLPERPLDPLDRELERHGMTITKNGALLECSGQLHGGEFTLPGNISSQYISGLLMALPLLRDDSVLHVLEPVESKDYIAMTEDVLSLSGIHFKKSGNDYIISGCQRYAFPEKLRVEGDYSSAAFFLCMGALSNRGVTVSGLDPSSSQGDRRIIPILSQFGAFVSVNGEDVSVRRGELHGITIDASMIPDLIPVLSVVAAAAQGETRVINAGRLRLKESDRLNTTSRMLGALGADVTETEDGLIIRGKPSLAGGSADSFGDHRIAMSAAAAAGVCTGPVTVAGAECTAKSYPGFWDDLDSLEVQ